MRDTLTFVVSLLLFVTGRYAQFETAEVLGTVRDASGAAVPGAAVTLTNQDTNIQTRGVTDTNGNYDFFNVRVGRYTVTVEHAGFAKASATDITVNVNARQRVDLPMQVGAVTESVEVTGAAAPTVAIPARRRLLPSKSEVEVHLLTAARAGPPRR